MTTRDHIERAILPAVEAVNRVLMGASGIGEMRRIFPQLVVDTDLWSFAKVMLGNLVVWDETEEDVDCSVPMLLARVRDSAFREGCLMLAVAEFCDSEDTFFPAYYKNTETGKILDQFRPESMKD